MQKSPKPLTRVAFLPDSPNIYLDHNATAPIAQYVREQIPEFLQSWGNAGSIHNDGRGPKAILREARQKLSQLLGCSPLELVFTSGGSESNNMVLKGLVCELRRRGRTQLLVSAVEHPSLIKTAEYLSEHGLSLDFIPVARDGSVDLAKYESLIRPETGLVSMMMANNETGSIFPIRKMAEIAHSHGALFHTDAVQALGKMPVNLHELDVDFASFSAHKFYSLKGAGALFVKRGMSLDPLIHGGAQERYRRAGTENILAIAAFGAMAEYAGDLPDLILETTRLRDLFEKLVLERLPDVRLTGNGVARACGSSSLVIPGVDGETMLMNLDMEGFSVSTGAACSSGNPEPSPVLLAMGLSRSEAQNSLRVSFGFGNSEEHVLKFMNTLEKVVKRIRALEVK